MLSERITTAALAIAEAVDRTLELEDIDKFNIVSLELLEIIQEFLWELLLMDVDPELEGQA